MSSGTPKDEGIQVEDLTWREQEILLLAERCSNREIADQLHMAETTIKDYVSKILSKLYVKNRRQAAYGTAPRNCSIPCKENCQRRDSRRLLAGDRILSSIKSMNSS